MKLLPSVSSEGNEEEPHFLINRNFALLWGGQAISNLGDYVFDTTLILWIAAVIARGQVWAPLAVSAVLFATALPTFVVGPIAGVFADRWENKRRTMLLMDAARAILIGLLIPITGLLPLPFLPHNLLSISWQLGAIYGVVFLASLCAQFFNPSRFALGVDIVPEQYRTRASGLGQVTLNFAIIVGPLLAASLIFTLGVPWLLFINACSFGISFLAILGVRLPKRVITAEPGRQNHFLHEFLEGVRFFATHRILRTVLITMCLVLFSGGVSESLNYFFVTQNLHVGPALYGLLSSATGIGLLFGAILASWGVQRIGFIRAFWLGIILLGLMEMLYARLTNFTFAFLVLSLQGIPNAALNVAMGPLLLHVTPRQYLGRTWSLLIPSMSVATMVSSLLAGYLVSTLLRTFHTVIFTISIGPIDFMIMVSGLLPFLGGLYAMVQLRKV
jgi:MFS family permease